MKGLSCIAVDNTGEQGKGSDHTIQYFQKHRSDVTKQLGSVQQ